MAAMEPEKENLLEEPVAEPAVEPVESPVQPAAEFNVFAQQGQGEKPESPDGLAFINVSGGDLNAAPEKSEGTAPAVGLWGKVQSGFESVRAARTSMTANLAPWSAFVNKNKFSVPKKTEVFSRVRSNLRIYHSNYMVLLGALAIWTAISNLYFVIAMMMSVGSYYYYTLVTSDGSPFVFRGREVSSVQFYFCLTAMTLLLFWLTGGGSTMFWMVASAAIVVFGHASFREADPQDVDSIGDAAAALGALNSLSQV